MNGAARGRRWGVAGTAVATALLLLGGPAERAAAQDRHPSIRIGGGQVKIGGRHVGFTGRGGDPHATGLLIRKHLHRLGDSRAHRFGPGRLRGKHGLRRFHGRHPAHDLRPFHGRSSFHRPLPGHHGQRVHRSGHLIVIPLHPLGSVALGGRLVRTTMAGRGASTLVAPGNGTGGIARIEGDRAGTSGETRPAAPPARVAPLPAERCADVTVHMLAGVAQTVRVDLDGLGARTPDEARELLEDRLARGEALALRGAYGGGLTAPGSVVRGVAVGACGRSSGQTSR